jgi:hypothetical protein
VDVANPHRTGQTPQLRMAVRPVIVAMPVMLTSVLILAALLINDVSISSMSRREYH